MKSISFASFKQLRTRLKVMEYSDRECMLVSDGGFSACLRMRVLGTAILKSIISQATVLIGNSSPEAGCSSESDGLTRAGNEWKNQKDKCIHGFERTKTEIYKWSRTDSYGKRDEARQDNFKFTGRTKLHSALVLGAKMLQVLVVKFPKSSKFPCQPFFCVQMSAWKWIRRSQ